MNEENSTGKINKLAFWPAVIALVAFVIAGIVNTQAVGNAMTKILSVIANSLERILIFYHWYF